MSYPEYMKQSIEKVEDTRDDRIGQTMPMMDLQERESILQKFHPDYKEGTKRPLKIGINKGDLMPHEVADILESNPIIPIKDIDLSKIDFDPKILIIGGGGAGIVAALWALKAGLNPDDLLIIQKLRLGDSNSKMSQGGIQAAVAEEDNPAIHYLDMIGGGHFTNKPKLVKKLVVNAPSIIQWHEQLGIMYDKESDGTLYRASGGGTSRRRMLSCKDYTGMEIVRVLMDELLDQKVPILEFTSAIELLTNEQGHVVGSVLYDMETDEYFVTRASATILATGGFGRLHIQGFPTTNHYGSTFDGVVLAYHVGAKLRDLDSVQYHPTGSAYPEQIVGLLCTEKLRGRGAQPVNKHGALFVNPLEPRDVESSAIIRESTERGNGITTPTGVVGVWLDTPLIDIINGPGTIQREFSAMLIKYNRFNIDIRQEPILVSPTLHYQNGGIEIDENTCTNIPGLFAAGEVAAGVHGKNRLMGNSILDYNVYGMTAGLNAVKYAQKHKSTTLSLLHVEKYQKMLTKAKIKTNRKSPILLPEYRGKKTLSRIIDIF